MTANGRRIKRRGSERSDELEASPTRALQASAEGSEHVSQLLDSQKRAYEVGQRPLHALLAICVYHAQMAN